MTELCDLCVKYGTDKVIWGYTPHYYERLFPKREQIQRVLEIGICGYRDIPNNVVGASLFVWRDFFPNAEVYGIDNDGRFIFNDQPRIHTAQCDAYDTRALDAALRSMGTGHSFDFIVDDAVHDPMPQVKLLRDLWEYLAPGGIYAMEDVCPYKLPNDDLNTMIDLFPPHNRVEIIETHKEERLLLIHKD